jgi:hypothetical protein
MASGSPKCHLDRLGRRLGDCACHPVLASTNRGIKADWQGEIAARLGRGTLHLSTKGVENSLAIVSIPTCQLGGNSVASCANSVPRSMGVSALLILLAGFALSSFSLGQKASAQPPGRALSSPPISANPVPPQRPVMNTLTGEVLLPSGRNFIGTRDGRIYVPAGPNGGLIDTRGGGFIPAR